MSKQLPIESIVWDPSIYPREKWSSQTITRYLDARKSGESFPPIVVEKDSHRLLDGKHRLETEKLYSAEYQQANGEWEYPIPDGTISVLEKTIPEGIPPKLFAASFSTRHGDRLTNADAKKIAREIFCENPEFKQEDIAEMLGVQRTTVSGYISDLLAKHREDRKAKALRLSMLGWTQVEIADRLGVSRQTIGEDAKNVESDISGIFDSGHPDEEIAMRLGWPIQLVKAKRYASKEMNDEARLADLNIKTQPYDVWHFQRCHDLMGDKHPGRVPGEIVCHVLYFYTKPGDLVIDPMAGSGTTADACLLMGRKCRTYDIDHRHERIDVEHADLSEGWPDKVSKASLVFWDPPYFEKMDDSNVKDGYGDDSISKLKREEYLEFFRARFQELYDVMKRNTVFTFLMSDWNDNDGKRKGIYLWDYADLLQGAGWSLDRQIQIPLSTQQVHPDIVNKFREQKKLARLNRSLLVARR